MTAIALRVSLRQAAREAVRAEPRAALYVAATAVDEVGVALSLWATQWMLTEVFVDQHARASFMMPMLGCFLLGALAAGPIADWSGPLRRASLARWRWKTILLARSLETAALAYLAVRLMSVERPTIGQVLPYFLVSALAKTGLRPTRAAFEVDLLRRERDQLESEGRVLVDDLGRPRRYKVHLVSLTAAVSALGVGATFVGLTLGGKLLAVADGRIWKIFAADVATTIVFLILFATCCRPPSGEAEERTPAPQRGSAAADLVDSIRQVAGFLGRPEQRPLLGLLALGWLTEFVNEFYEGKMILRHQLGGTEPQIRHSQMAWSLASLLVLCAAPLLTARLGRLGRLVGLAVILDGVAISLGGLCVLRGALLPFAAVLCFDRALTDASSTLTLVAQNSACRAALRGRVMAAYALVVLVSDIAAEAVATAIADQVGIARMLVGLGLAQALVALAVLAMASGRVWSYGIWMHPLASPIRTEGRCISAETEPAARRGEEPSSRTVTTPDARIAKGSAERRRPSKEPDPG